MTQEADVLAALGRIEDAQAALRRMLGSVKPSRLVERPPSGHWSPMENLRHLVFAEQHHFGPFLERGFRWSAVDVPPPNRKGERRLNSVGTDPATPVADVFDAWTRVHEVIRSLAVQEQGKLTPTLEGNLKHVALHARTIERLLRS
jgi:hypothetical protein